MVVFVDVSLFLLPFFKWLPYFVDAVNVIIDVTVCGSGTNAITQVTELWFTQFIKFLQIILLLTEIFKNF